MEIQPQPVHIQKVKGLHGHLAGDSAVEFHLGKIPDPFQKAIGKPGRPSGPPGNLLCPSLFNLHFQYPGGPEDDIRQFLHRIKLQPVHHAKTVPQRRRQKPRPGSSPHQRKMGQVQPDRPGRRPLPDHNIDGVVLHGRVQYLLHLPVQPVNLIHKKDIPLLQAV